MQNKILFILFIIELLCFSFARASIISLPNQSPIAAIFGIPSPVDFDEPENRFSVDFNVANNFVPRSSTNENLFLDGETSRLVTQYRRQLSDCWMFGIEVPIVSHAGGVLDSFVDDWHQWFDLPESGRPNVAHDQLTYSYTVNGKEVIHQSALVTGIGDASLMLTQRQRCTGRQGQLFRVGLKLATGNPDSILGSGASDVFLDLSRRFEGIYRSIDFSYTAGVLLAGKSPMISKHYRQIVYGAISFERAISERFSLDSQIAIQSPTIESHLRVLSDWPVQLLIGVSMQASPSTVWHVALSEDPEYGTSSDVAFQLGVRTSY